MIATRNYIKNNILGNEGLALAAAAETGPEDVPPAVERTPLWVPKPRPNILQTFEEAQYEIWLKDPTQSRGLEDWIRRGRKPVYEGGPSYYEGGPSNIEGDTE
jgi:hypothetical protein